ncbi:auxin-responsive protein IAA13-like [Mercurialis annua]|uniref:auxin-responsive protein IAA13-like n=1 Tax=Mercurialis annua TaxID=3986 RepID=UPI00215F01BB|nr:auxin-responsive protein IAA13-like [Mercurialis annua]
MKGGLALLGGGSGGGGGGEDSTNESVVSSPVEVEAELELGLGLSIGGGGRLFGGGSVSGTKRAADSVSNASQQVVGWPPLRAYRMNSLVNQAKASRSEEDKSVVIEKDYNSKDVLKKNGNNRNEKLGFVGFVKVNMDGVPIGRKIDLNAHNSYDTLSQSLEDMFFHSITSLVGEKQQAMKPSKLLEGSSEFVLTYEDKDGDWMLVGDVPWGMFVTSVKRLRIMRTSDDNGLAPRFQETNRTRRSKPI